MSGYASSRQVATKTFTGETCSDLSCLQYVISVEKNLTWRKALVISEGNNKNINQKESVAMIESRREESFLLL